MLRTFRGMNTGPSWPQALLEVCLCSGAPTQLLVGGVLALFGLRAGPDGQVTLQLVAFLAGLDTLILVTLVFALLVAGGESPRQVLLGTRQVAGEVLRGFGLLPWVFLLAVGTGMVLMRWAPGLFTPEPVRDAGLRHAWSSWCWRLVAVLAGGVREEIQRAFILHRFEQRLGGALVGVLALRRRVRRRPLRPGLERGDHHGAARHAVERRLPGAAQRGRADGQPRLVQPDRGDRLRAARMRRGLGAAGCWPPPSSSRCR